TSALSLKKTWKRCRQTHARRVPLISGHSLVDAVAAPTPDNVEGAGRAVHCLAGHDVALKGVGSNHVIVVCIPRTPNQARSSEPVVGLKFRFNKAILDARSLFERQRKSRLARLLEHQPLRRCGVVAVHERVDIGRCLEPELLIWPR